MRRSTGASEVVRPQSVLDIAERTLDFARLGLISLNNLLENSEMRIEMQRCSAERRERLNAYLGTIRTEAAKARVLLRAAEREAS